MLSELDKEVFRQIVLANGFISSVALSTICDVSTNTIRKSVDSINDFLSEKSCFIDSKISSGYCLVITNEEKATPFIQKTIEEIERFKYLDTSNLSSAYIILFGLLKKNGYIPIEHMMDSLYCSKSTITRILENVRLLAKRYSLELKNKRNYGFYIEGGEWEKRTCISFLEKVNHHSDLNLKPDAYFPLLKDDNLRNSVRQIVYSVFENYPLLPFQIVQYNSMSITNWIIISMIRSQYSNQYNLSEDFINLAKKLPTYLISKDICKIVEQKHNVSFNENDYLTLSAVIASCVTINSLDGIDKNQLFSIKQETNDLILFINNYLKYDEIYNLCFYESFYKYLYTLSLKTTFQFVSDSENLYPSTRMGLLSCDFCSYFALFYKKRHGITLKENDLIDAYYIFNQAIFSSNSYLQYPYHLNAAICARSGYYQALNVRERIIAQFPNTFDSITVLEHSQLFNKDLTNFDLLLTNFDSNKSFGPSSKKIQCVPFGRIHFDNSFKELSNYLHTIIVVASKKVFSEENYHIVSFTSKKMVLDTIYENVKDEFNSREQFLNDLAQRDEFISFEKNKGIVMLCPLAHKSSKPYFHVFVSKEPIVWKNNKNSIFIFYSRGNGSINENSIINYLLKQFLHQHVFFLNTMHLKTYKEIVRNFQ